MGTSLNFASVPFENDGCSDDLYANIEKRVLREGVVLMAVKSLSLNVHGITQVDVETDGAFLAVLDGDGGCRYVRLSGKRNDLEVLRLFIPAVKTEYVRKFIEKFLQNADAALQKYGDQAAVIIT